MKVAFYSHHLSERGTEVAMYDYARYNEEILGNESIIIYNINSPPNHPTSIEKFSSRFQVVGLDLPGSGISGDKIIPEIDKVLSANRCDILYHQNAGRNEGLVSKYCRTVILACGTNYDPHGDKYAYVSRWLSNVMTAGRSPWLPIIIDLLDTQESLRNELRIPQDAFVFGRTGGLDTWNIPWASFAVCRALEKRKDLYFVFQNTPVFVNHERVKFVKTTADPLFKSMFINTCDAMIHARAEGESFGQSIAEFSTKNKPIVTFANSPERSHIDILREKGVYYDNHDQLLSVLVSLEKTPDADWNCYKEHSPQNGIEMFKKVFLD